MSAVIRSAGVCHDSSVELSKQCCVVVTTNIFSNKKEKRRSKKENGCQIAFNFMVNISNTWTLPQEGFTVFYRFFRDKISWFEADAVCQFHHANLVTVENSFQFDATRDFLKVLEVVEPVWIGLMRAQSSKRFAWSNSKPLPSESGYWAEPLPIMESPLCAVIDPARDFRWHALRCGGPETASFICEMNVPNWAEECTVKEVPSLTIQYMADSGSVELSKDCGEEGTVHQICKGKKDRQRILKDLFCKAEKAVEVGGRNPITSTDLADTHFKSLQIIKNVSSGNDEDNNISTQQKKPKEEKKKDSEPNAVQKLIEQFNVEELMQSEQSQHGDGQQDETTLKPVKKTFKKAKAFEKKDKFARKKKLQKTKEKAVPLEDMMMGDQPMQDISGAAEEPLPHIKKSLPQDLRHLESNTKLVGTTTSTSSTTTTSSSSSASSPTTIPTLKQEVESTSVTFSSEINESNSSLSGSIFAASIQPPVETKTGLIGHPMHPHQPRDGVAMLPAEDGNAHSLHIKETGDSHFIPPMLLVKSHYTSTKSHLETIEKSEVVAASNLSEFSTNEHESSILELSAPPAVGVVTISSKTIGNLRTSNDTTLTESSTGKGAPKVDENVSSTTLEPPSTEHHIIEIKIGNSDNPATFSITTRSDPAVTTTSQVGGTTSIHHQDMAKNELPTTKNHQIDSHSSEQAANSGEDQSKRVKNKFSNEENFQPFKPNRRRSLTKPETITYLKKILG